jgi:hypothetical protein
LSALSALSGTRDGSGAPLRIYTSFQPAPAKAVESFIQRELASLVAPIGLRLDWKSLAEPRDGDISLALVVVTFRGRCNVAGLEPRHIEPGALAWTHVSDGVILPFVDVDCDGLRDFLQTKLLKIDARFREQLYGRAIARVLGHELYHVFTETTHHGKEGVSQPTFTVADLLSDNFEFAEKEFRTLRSSKLRSLLPPRKSRAPGGHAAYAAEGCSVCHGAAGEGTHWAPALRCAAKSVDPKVLTSRFDRKSEEMYRRARNLNLIWQFPSDDELREIVAVLSTGLDE